MMGTILPYRGVVPTVADSVFLAPNATVIGDVVIGADTNIWFGCVIRGDVNIVRIGQRTNIQDGTIVHVSREKFGTFIGDDVTIGHLALIHACTLEDRCFIGMNATVMDGCVVEPEAMVAAGAVVTPGKRVRTGQLWAGTPAKHIRDLSREDRDGMSATAPHYVRLARTYREEAADAPLSAHG
ncbi:MAG: gamma carbonic anhydrase family protein [Rhodospirillales bacterium]|nr:MAG: gamma carbonic anhydrase family protein [Rhodospirillales bacterium]